MNRGVDWSAKRGGTHVRFPRPAAIDLTARPKGVSLLPIETIITRGRSSDSSTRGSVFAWVSAMDRTCRHCGHQLPVPAGLFCPHCRKAILELTFAPEPPPAVVPPPSFDERRFKNDQPRARLVALLASLSVFGILVGVTFDPKVQVKAEQAFGTQPLGMTPQGFALLLQIGLFLPVPWFFHHLSLLLMQARRDGFSPMGGLWGIALAFATGQFHPHLRRSKLICLSGLVYFLLICSAWIAYSAYMGIYALETVDGSVLRVIRSAVAPRYNGLVESRERQTMSIAQHGTKPLRAGQRLSVREFLRRWEAMPAVKFAELIDGVVYMPSPTTSDHGRIELWIATWLGIYILNTPGCAAGSQATWLMLQSAPQPDTYLWIRPECGGHSTIHGQYHAGAPELAAEICLTSAAYDLGVKKTLYQAAGVREYIAVLIEEEEVRWHRLVNGEYKLCRPNSQGIFRSKEFPGLWLDGQALWEGDIGRLVRMLERGLKSAAHATFVKKLATRKN